MHEMVIMPTLYKRVRRFDGDLTPVEITFQGGSPGAPSALVHTARLRFVSIQAARSAMHSAIVALDAMEDAGEHYVNPFDSAYD